MKIKSSADIRGLDIRMRPALLAADRIWKDLGQELCITSGLDGEHSAGSLHYYGLAVDLRTKYFKLKVKNVAENRLKDVLGSSFDVILKKTHIHVEYDPK